MDSTPGPYPFLPLDFFGLLLEKDGHSLVLWTQSRSVEPASEESADQTQVRALEALVPTLRGPKLADVVRQVEDHGYRLRGERRFNFRSGELYQDARILASMAARAGEQNRRLVTAHGGTNPPLQHEDWNQWERLTRQRNATCKGARVLGMASLEAFVNEVLSLNFPEVYRKLEEKQRATPIKKLKALCESLGITVDEPWRECIEDNLTPRRQIVHHRPGFVDDEGDPHSVEPSDVINPDAVARFLDCIDELFAVIFAAYGVRVPPTHQPPSSVEG